MVTPFRRRDHLATNSTLSTKPRTSNKWSRTLTWAELPAWQKDNEYIISGYRRAQNDWRGCFISVYAYLHNETVNIHSHFWGALLFIYLIINFNSQLGRELTWMDTAVFNVFLFSAVFCLCASALYHTASCHSEEISSSCHALDYSGIIILTAGSFYPSLYYGFHCQKFVRLFYMLSITFVGFGAAYVVLHPEFAKPTHRGARTIVFICLGLNAVVPVSHLLKTHGSTRLFSEMGFGWLVASGALYIVGALLYANRIPERLAPGRFDYFLASHQNFHFLVVLAALAHYYGVLKALDYRLSLHRC